MKTFGGFLALIAASSFGSQACAQDAAPSFDCAKAAGTVEELVCHDSELAALDRRMAEVYAQAQKEWPENVAAEQRALQRGWIKGRNDCWKAKNVKECVMTSYQQRVVELQIQSGQLQAATPTSYECDGSNAKPFTASFYNETDPPSVVLTYDGAQAIAFVATSGSGARYTATNMEFWEHQEEATVDWYGIKLRCDVVR
jgi:uncharacterized protein